MVPVEESHKADDVESKAVEKPGVNIIKLFFCVTDAWCCKKLGCLSLKSFREFVSYASTKKCSSRVGSCLTQKH